MSPRKLIAAHYSIELPKSTRSPPGNQVGREIRQPFGLALSDARGRNDRLNVTAHKAASNARNPPEKYCGENHPDYGHDDRCRHCGDRCLDEKSVKAETRHAD